jgi:hypothetical protein
LRNLENGSHASSGRKRMIMFIAEEENNHKFKSLEQTL